jgi:hypothetical protein
VSVSGFDVSGVEPSGSVTTKLLLTHVELTVQ